MKWPDNDQNPFNNNIRRPKHFLSFPGPGWAEEEEKRRKQKDPNSQEEGTSLKGGRGRTATFHTLSTPSWVPAVYALCLVPCLPWPRGRLHSGGLSVCLPSVVGIQLLTVTRSAKLSNHRLTMLICHIIHKLPRCSSL